MRILFIVFALAVSFVQLLPALPANAHFAGLAAVVSFLSLLYYISFHHPHFPLSVPTLLLTILFGFSWSLWRAQTQINDELPTEWEGKDIELIGIIASLPNQFPCGERFVFETEQVITKNAIVPKKILLSWYCGYDDGNPQKTALWPLDQLPPQAGERWQFTIRLKRPHGNANSHGFDYDAWLFEQGIRAQGYIQIKNRLKRLSAQVLQPQALINKLRSSIRERFSSELGSAPYRGVLTALAIGDQNAIDTTLWRVFNQTGTTHLMSISGLHVTLVAVLFAWFIKQIWCRQINPFLGRIPAPTIQILSGLIAAGCYSLLAGFAIPTQRTFFMLLTITISAWQARTLAPSRVLLPALAVVIFIDPWASFSAGFWLSFGAVALILFISHGRKMPPKSTWRQRLLGWSRIQLAITLGTLPLLLMFFQQFPLLSPLANAIAIPLISLIITPITLCAIIIPHPVLLELAHILLSPLMQFLLWLQSSAGWSVWTQAIPPPWTLWVALLGITCILLPRSIPVHFAGGILILPALLPTNTRPLPGEAELTVLDVGQGLAVHIRTNKHDLLYDTGPSFRNNDAGDRIIIPYLRATGTKALAMIIVSHADNDHAGGLKSLLANIPIKQLVTSFDQPKADFCQAGKHWQWDEVTFTFLHPQSKEQKSTDNEQSCVLRIEAKSNSVLLTGDIGQKEETKIIHRNGAQKIAADIIVAPHHGSRTSSSSHFIKAVKPREVIFSAAYRNRFNHPNPEVIARYQDLVKARIWRTDLDGAVRIQLTDRYKIIAFRQQFRRYWRTL